MNVHVHMTVHSLWVVCATCGTAAEVRSSTMTVIPETVGLPLLLPWSAAHHGPFHVKPAEVR